MEEANTIKLALLLPMDRGWKRICILGTNKGLLQKLVNKDPNDALCDPIIENILSLDSMFFFCILMIIDKKINVLASTIVRFAIDLKHAIRWENNFPLQIMNIAQDIIEQLPFL